MNTNKVVAVTVQAPSTKMAPLAKSMVERHLTTETGTIVPVLAGKNDFLTSEMVQYLSVNGYGSHSAIVDHVGKKTGNRAPNKVFCRKALVLILALEPDQAKAVRGKFGYTAKQVLWAITGRPVKTGNIESKEYAKLVAEELMRQVGSTIRESYTPGENHTYLPHKKQVLEHSSKLMNAVQELALEDHSKWLKRQATTAKRKATTAKRKAVAKRKAPATKPITTADKKKSA